MTTADYQDDIERLCRLNRVRLTYGSTGRAWRRKRLIRIPEVKSAVTYALALHELGHILGKCSGRRLEKEVQAWEWAIENACEWTPAMQRKTGRSIASYLRWCRRRKGAWIPPVGHAAYELAGV